MCQFLAFSFTTLDINVCSSVLKTRQYKGDPTKFFHLRLIPFDQYTNLNVEPEVNHNLLLLGGSSRINILV